jgi:threonine synthase
VSSVSQLICVVCSRIHGPGSPWTCSNCGPDEGILDVQYDLAAARRTLTRAVLASRPFSHWRYAELLPLDGPPPAALQNIGWSPIIEAPRLATALGVGRIRLKDEGRSASASFKDRASSVGVAHAIQLGKNEIGCASTGNAASSLAHCAAAVGLRCNIFVPQSVPEGKLAQLLAYGARVFKVMGSYAQAYELCTQACAKFGWYNRNCAINPYLVEGKKTGGMEVAEQCADDPPEWVAVSVGDGCTIAGIYKGIAQMKAVGIIGWNAKMLGVQAAGVAPIAEVCRRVAEGAAIEKITLKDLKSRDTTYADSINCPVPRNWRKAVNAIRESGGACVTVSDEQIMEAVRVTGRESGVFAEPAAAAAVAGIAEARRTGILNENSNVVAMITGNGLKDIAGALRAVGKPHEVKAELGEIERVLAKGE